MAFVHDTEAESATEEADLVAHTGPDQPVIVVADDEPFIVKMLSTVLGQDVPNAVIVECKNERELDAALRRYKGRIKVLLTDSNLGTGGGEGHRILASIRRGDYGADLKDLYAIFMCGEPDNTFDHDPHVKYLSKPFELDQAVNAVTDALALKDVVHDPGEGQRARDHAGKVLFGAFQTPDIPHPVGIENPGADPRRFDEFMNARVHNIEHYTAEAFHEGAPNMSILLKLNRLMESGGGYLYFPDDRQALKMSVAMKELNGQIERYMRDPAADALIAVLQFPPKVEGIALKVPEGSYKERMDERIALLRDNTKWAFRGGAPSEEKLKELQALIEKHENAPQFSVKEDSYSFQINVAMRELKRRVDQHLGTELS